MATLRVLKGSNKGSLIALSAECIVLGRDPSADIMLDGVSVSRKHAILRRIQGMYCIEDTKSCNGTFLNGKKVTSQMWLRDEDEITICDTVLVYDSAPCVDETREIVHAIFGGAQGEEARVVQVLNAGLSEDDYERLRIRLERSHVFWERADVSGLRSAFQEAGSRVSEILGDGFHRLVVLDATEGIDSSTGAFDLDVFLRYIQGVLIKVFELNRPPEVHHNQDIAQCLRDEQRSLFCFLGVEYIPVADLRRLRGFTQGKHQSLFVCRGSRDLITEEEEFAREVAREDSSLIMATLKQSGQESVEGHLAMLNEMGAEFAEALEEGKLLGKIVDRLFAVFNQADCAFLIVDEEGKLIPKVSKTRRNEDGGRRFSKSIVNRVLETGRAILSEDASAGVDLSQSIADCRIRSMMCVPLIGRSNTAPFGVIQLDTQERSNPFTEDDLKLLLAVAGLAAMGLRNAEWHSTIVKVACAQRDQELARSIQSSLLPTKMPRVPGYEFWAGFEPGEEVGGDFHSFIALPNGRHGVIVGEVAGKGIPVALLTAKVNAHYRWCAMTKSKLSDMISELNMHLQEAGWQDRFVTLAAGQLNPIQHEVTFANAGHIAPLIYRLASDTFEEGTTSAQTGLPLGILEGIPYDSNTVSLGPGDCVLFMTDGITRIRKKDEKAFQQDLAIAALRAGPMVPRAMVGRLAAAVHRQVTGLERDELTVVAFGRVSTTSGDITEELNQYLARGSV